jgi:NAD(P)-dependent dehydrogenase (short-subunit alcohol dehydrogenase family)
VARNLVIVTGASSGIGLALAETVPYDDARVIDVSRRGAKGCEHVAADLADPTSWPVVVGLFEREVAGFEGDRVVFFHCAGTIQPIGFAGEVDVREYTRNVLLNSAAPQVLGDAFLHATRRTQAECHLIMISSGAAHSVYAGWTSYGAGKAAVDQWVRAAGTEQALRGRGCRVLSVAPGVVATAMQEQIRAMSSVDFPEVAKFVDLHETGALREPKTAAREIWALLERDLANGSVLDLRDA